MIIKTKNLTSVWDKYSKSKRKEISKDDYMDMTQLVLSSYYYFGDDIFYCPNLHEELANYSINRIRVTYPPKEDYDQAFVKIEVDLEGKWKVHQNFRQV